MAIMHPSGTANISYNDTTLLNRNMQNVRIGSGSLHLMELSTAVDISQIPNRLHQILVQSQGVIMSGMHWILRRHLKA